MPIRSILLLILVSMAASGWTGSAHAEAVRLRGQVCYATAPRDAAADGRSVAALPFDCARAPAYSAYRDGWVWLKLRDVRALAGLPAGWKLVIDQVRFDRMVVLATARDGTVQAMAVTPDALADDVAPGGMLRFTVARAGADTGALYVGFRRLDHLSLMRKLNADSEHGAMHLDHIWLGLMGVFAGAILSAFAYNLLIYTGPRLAFQGGC